MEIIQSTFDLQGLILLNAFLFLLSIPIRILFPDIDIFQWILFVVPLLETIIFIRERIYFMVIVYMSIALISNPFFSLFGFADALYTIPFSISIILFIIGVFWHVFKKPVVHQRVT